MECPDHIATELDSNETMPSANAHLVNLCHFFQYFKILPGCQDSFGDEQLPAHVAPVKLFQVKKI